MRRVLKCGTVAATMAVVGCGGRTFVPIERSNALIISQGRWSAGGAQGVAIRTPRVRLFTNVQNVELRDKLPIVLEHSISGFDRFWPNCPDPDPELEVVVYAEFEQWRAAVKKRIGIDAGIGLRYGAGTSGGVSLLHDIELDWTLRLAAHEIWHGYGQRVLKTPLPVAIDEALSCYAEGMRWEAGAAAPALVPRNSPTRSMNISALFRADMLGSLSDHFATSPHDYVDTMSGMDHYYARAWCLSIMLLDSGDATLKRGVARLLEDARRGTPAWTPGAPGHIQFDQLCEHYFERSPEEMEAIWQKTASSIVAEKRAHIEPSLTPTERAP